MCEPLSRMRPSPTTIIISQSWIVDSRCAIAKDVRPCLAASRAFETTCSLWLSKALVASSSSRIGGFLARPLHIATRCFWPPERRDPLGPTCVCQPCALSMNPMLAISFN
mmetsp:Transcript_2674/g.4539  ORF Transcript_2674/g.4539 Transcript_2674/m.4539 type:complete len:110 (+) Transcript_2674:280-609(+)